MGDSGEIRYLFTGRIEERDGSYVIEVPEREVVDGDLEEGETGRVGLFAVDAGGGSGERADAETEAAGSGTDAGAAAREERDVGVAEEPGATGASAERDEETEEPDESVAEPSEASGGDAVGGTESLDEVEFRDPSEPPVDEGERRTVEIEDEGEQGDGLARIDRGYIVFVPGTEPGDAVEIEITDTKENFAFGEVVE